MGAGMSAQISVYSNTSSNIPAATLEATREAHVEVLAMPASVAPWVGARIGIQGDNEAGLSYSGRSIRIDGRHAWNFGEADAYSLSLGLGGSAVMAEQPRDHPDSGGVFGGGVDLPLLFGWRSKSDLYALWIGPRGGFETMSGTVSGPRAAGSSEATIDAVSAKHYYVGFVAGLRAGFRHVHVALELDGAFHWANGTIGGMDVDLHQFTLTPGGALIVSF